MGRLRRAVPIATFLAWAVLIGAGLLAATVRGGSEPVDYQTYHRAATALARGTSPYQTPAQSLALWRSYHRLDAAIRAAHTLRAAGGDPLARTPPGPYLYLPTLALLVGRSSAGGRRCGGRPCGTWRTSSTRSGSCCPSPSRRR